MEKKELEKLVKRFLKNSFTKEETNFIKFSYIPEYEAVHFDISELKYGHLQLTIKELQDAVKYKMKIEDICF